MKLRGLEAVIMLGTREAASLAHWTLDPLEEGAEEAGHTFAAKVKTINERRMKDEEGLSVHFTMGAIEYIFQPITVIVADDEDVDLLLHGDPKKKKV